MDVGDDDPAQVERSEAQGIEGRMDSGDTRLGTGLDQRGHRPVNEESRGELLHAAEQRVELANPRGDLDRVAHGSATSGYGDGDGDCCARSAFNAVRSCCTLVSSAPYAV